MSLHYLLDGYNIIHQMPGSIPRKLEDQRLYLIRFIETNQPQGSLNNKVTVVFDGQAGVYGRTESTSVRVIFSKIGTADDKIKKIVEETKLTKNVIVVTDDRAIQYAVRASGAKVKSVKEFLKAANDSNRSKTVSGTGKKGKYIPKNIEHKINSELEQVWLKKKKEE